MSHRSAVGILPAKKAWSAPVLRVTIVQARTLSDASSSTDGPNGVS